MFARRCSPDAQAEARARSATEETSKLSRFIFTLASRAAASNRNGGRELVAPARRCRTCYSFVWPAEVATNSPRRFCDQFCSPSPITAGRSSPYETISTRLAPMPSETM